MVILDFECRTVPRDFFRAHFPEAIKQNNLVDIFTCVIDGSPLALRGSVRSCRMLTRSDFMVEDLSDNSGYI